MLKQTHTFALLAIPPAAFTVISETLRELDEGARIFLIDGDNGYPINAIDMAGIALTGDVEDNRDLIAEIGEMSDLTVAIGEDAFIAGFKACSAWFNQPYDAKAGQAAWSNYTPPEHLTGG